MLRIGRKMSQKQLEEVLAKVEEAYDALDSVRLLIENNTRETSTFCKRYGSLRLKTWKLKNLLQGELGARRILGE